MTKDTGTDTSESQATSDQSSPMAMGMSMAKKMLKEMGEGGPSPMATIKKVMAQMSEGQPGGQSIPPMMQMCMGMCSEMLTAIKRTTDLAAFATPEFNQLFADWLATVKDEAIALVAKDSAMDVASLAKALSVSEDSAVFLITQLAKEGAITIDIRPAADSDKTNGT